MGHNRDEVRRSVSRFDSILWDLASTGGVLSLANVAAMASGKPQEHIVAETLIVEDANPLDVIRPKGDTPVEVLDVGSVGVMKVENENGTFTVSAWPTPYDGVFHLIGGLPATDSRWGKVDRWITNAAPKAVRCFLDHADFLDIGTALSEHADVEVQRLTGRMRADRSGYGRSFPARAGDELRPDPREIVRQAESHGAAVRTMHLHVGEVADVVIRREAGATFVHGDFEVFEERILNRLAVAAHRRRELMSNRQRVVDQTPKQPIQVRLSTPMLTDATATGHVLDELAVPSHGLSYAVLHRNPYLHVSVLDESDGSNYDVFVTQPDAIEIHPGFRATLGSLTRLAQALGDRFEALALAEEPDDRPESFYDMVDSGADGYEG